ncbi:hypothetical protein M1247_18810 [Mycobacterium sp. 21AC1]|uniref:hypothetical protein n=1 Tax=[Mycobacterium] appelbergii TaxID=2939269 RepID=UPI00293929B0|nr:hypothetical protein [Mycobacterium sp. 21AC1]MDV3126981.1 hypothetical protein [Mycobacterium sp. 21AC1]
MDWLRWVGFADARRVDNERPEGISGTGVRASVTFDSLPLGPSRLASLHRWADLHGACVVAFSFAGWTPDTYEIAGQLDIALLRYTFAGNIEADNPQARSLVAHRRQAPRREPERKRH